MQDVTLYDDGRVVFKKHLWNDAELLLARCFNFEYNVSDNIVTATVGFTFKKAMYEFIRLSFKNFSESLHEEDRRNDFYTRLDAMYHLKDQTVDALMQQHLPYYSKLYAHQMDTIKQSFYHQFVFGALDMGLGKTLIAASVSRIMQAQRTVIICPSAVKWNWYRDLTAWGFNELFFTILDAKRHRNITALNERFVIVNYDIIGNVTPHLLATPVSHFILDESHYLKNHNALRYKNVQKIIAANPNAKITFLSGTPITNRVNDLFGYFKLIGHELSLSHAKFMSEYTIRTNARGGEKVTGGRNLQDLTRKLSNFMIRKIKEECLDLPGKIFLSYRFEMDDYREEYDKVIAELAEQKSISSLTGNLHSLNIITSKAKIPGIKELADEIIESGKKVVIFGSYRVPIDAMAEYFGNRCVKIDGSVDSFTRDQHIQRFHNDPECVVFLGNMKAAGVGINLTNASDVIFMNFPFTPAELYQATDRCDRIGQKYAVNVHYTFCDGSIDEYIYDIITDKEKDINTLIDQGKEAVLRENTTEILIKKLLNRNNLDDIIIDAPYTEIEGETENQNNTEDNAETLNPKLSEYEGIQRHDGQGATENTRQNNNQEDYGSGIHRSFADEADKRNVPVSEAKTYNTSYGQSVNGKYVGSGENKQSHGIQQDNDSIGIQYGAERSRSISETNPKSFSEPSFDDMAGLVTHVEDNKSQYIEKESVKTHHITNEIVQETWEYFDKIKKDITARTSDAMSIYVKNSFKPDYFKSDKENSLNKFTDLPDFD